MYNIQQTPKFLQWLTKLKDMRARIAIARRIERAQSGNLGDVKSVGKVFTRCVSIWVRVIGSIIRCVETK